jgi:hypothetical protein
MRRRVAHEHALGIAPIALDARRAGLEQDVGAEHGIAGALHLEADGFRRRGDGTLCGRACRRRVPPDVDPGDDLTGAGDPREGRGIHG